MTQIGDVILDLNQRGLTVLLVEQKLPFARKVADRYCILDKGRVLSSGVIADLDNDLARSYLSV